MGHDGAAGMKSMLDVGARTLAQDEGTSVVFGIAHEADKLGAVESFVPLEALAGRILQVATESGKSRKGGART